MLADVGHIVVVGSLCWPTTARTGQSFVEHLLQLGMDRDCQLGAGLLLPNVQHAIADVLPPHPQPPPVPA
jgi:hypothetical protein